MSEANVFNNVPLIGGLLIVDFEMADAPFVDAIGREAIARTQITDRKLSIQIRAGLSENERSVTLYHEILEAATVAVSDPPESVIEFNEGDFERAGYEAFDQFGPASPDNLNRMLQSYGFRER